MIPEYFDEKFLHLSILTLWVNGLRVQIDKLSKQPAVRRKMS